MTGPVKVYLLYYFLVALAFALFVLGGRKTVYRRLLWGGGGALVLLTMTLLARYSEPNRFGDDFLKAYYPAGGAILRDPARIYGNDGNLTFANIPIVAFLFAPLSSLTDSIAALVFGMLGIVATLLGCYGLVKLSRVSSWRAAALFALAAVNGPLWHSFLEGNLTHFVLPLLVGVLYFATNRREGLAGVCLAIAGLIKLPLFLLAVYFLARKRWSVIAGFSATLLAIVGLSVTMFGVDLHLRWWRECIAPFASRPLTAYNVQSLHAFLARCLTNGSIGSWLPVNVDWQFKAIEKAVSFGLAATIVCVFWRAHHSEPAATYTEFSIVLCAALITSPLSWTHYYLLLVIPAGLYLGERSDGPDHAPLAFGNGGKPAADVAAGPCNHDRCDGVDQVSGFALLFRRSVVGGHAAGRPLESRRRLGRQSPIHE